jgi:GntR family transcriptional regulator
MMRIRVDANSGVPVFRQIVDQVRFQIASGVLAAGEEIPSTRALSLKLGVNPMTISKAYGLLEEERLIEHRPGLPLVVRAIRAEAAERDRLDLLRAALDPAVAAARQLGVSTAKSTALFRQMLADAANEED